MQDIKKPFSRVIPRPRVRHTPPEIRDTKRLTIKKRLISRLKIDSAEKNFSKNLMEGLSLPESPGGIEDSMGDLNSPETYSTANDYYEMIRMRIEKNKRYPESAKSRHIEGRVKVQFTITTDGQVSSLKILRNSGNRALDEAALDAILDSAPFPVPPRAFFKGSFAVAMTIIFELR